MIKVTIIVKDDGKMVLEGLPDDYLLGLRTMLLAARMADKAYQDRYNPGVKLYNELPPKIGASN